MKRKPTDRRGVQIFRTMDPDAIDRSPQAKIAAAVERLRLAVQRSARMWQHIAQPTIDPWQKLATARSSRSQKAALLTLWDHHGYIPYQAIEEQLGFQPITWKTFLRARRKWQERAPT